MGDDRDDMWKPGFVAPPAGDGAPSAPPGSSRARGPADTSIPDSGSGGPGAGVVDRFRPAAGPRSDRRSPATDPPLGSLHVEFDAVAPAGWSDDRDAEDPVASRRPWRTAALVVLGIAATAIVVLVVLTAIGGEGDPRRPGPDEITGADVRRLPAEVERLWATTLPGSGNALSSTFAVDGRALVVAIVDDGSRNRTSIAAVDATSGSIRWRRSFSFSPPEASVIGVFDGVVLIEQQEPSARHLMGLSADDGETIWERSRPRPWINVVLLGTDVVANIATDGAALVTFVDPSTGAEVGDVVGELVSTDLAGTWYVLTGDQLQSIDLSNGWSEPQVIATTSELPPSPDLAVIDGRLLVRDSLGRVREFDADAGALTVLQADGVPRIDSMFPAGGSSIIARNDEEIFGLEVTGDAVRTTWRQPALMRTFALTERGVVLSITDEGAGFDDSRDLAVVDAVTGDRLAGAPSASGEDPPLIVGNGFVTAVDSVAGTERLGYDLDGTLLWRLPVTGKFEVGDGLVVTLTDTPAGYELVAYGERP